MLAGRALAPMSVHVVHALLLSIFGHCSCKGMGVQGGGRLFRFTPVLSPILASSLPLLFLKPRMFACLGLQRDIADRARALDSGVWVSWSWMYSIFGGWSWQEDLGFAEF